MEHAPILRRHLFGLPPFVGDWHVHTMLHQSNRLKPSAAFNDCGTRMGRDAVPELPIQIYVRSDFQDTTVKKAEKETETYDQCLTGVGDRQICAQTQTETSEGSQK